jgi:hypothetical protein
MREPSCTTRDGWVAGWVAGLTIAASTGFWGALSQPQSARRHTEKSAHLTASRHYMSTVEEPHKVGNGGRFVCGCLPFMVNVG